MRTRFAYIILLLSLIFSPVISLASSSSGENKNHSSAHDKLSCLDCHSYIKEDSEHPSVEDSNASCNECHDNFSGLSSPPQQKVNCLNCHSRHNEKVANDAHINVPCRACHLYDIKPVKKIENNIPVWRYEPRSKKEYNPHLLATEKEKICSRCHYKGNNLGAPDRTLPAKSIICMPCHAATLTIGDIPSVAAVIIFLIGISGIAFMWLAAGKSHIKKEGLKLTDFISVINALILDGLFQRRLFKVSVKRWIIHAMIFFPLFVRFVWGLAALVLSLINPEWNVTWVMLNKNNPTTGLVFDITGILIIVGGCFMYLERRAEKRNNSIKDLPKSNTFINVLLGGVLITGFIVEGARIAMTGSPEGSQFAFIGYGISRALLNYHLNGVYAYLWYLHTCITVAFVACLPFSRMFHIFTAPLSLLLRGASKK